MTDTSPTTRILTGITPSGAPHLGNYAGMLRPAIAASTAAGVENFYFLADWHALIKCRDAARVQRSTLEIAASWLAAGLDPQRVVFYRQSDIVEIPELCWLLTCVCGKGLLNRAHAYKAMLDKNRAEGAEPDDGVTAGLFMYPVLMAADILAFNAHQVPVGRDQVQHIEMARDMAASFNHLYGGAFFTLPEARVEEHVSTLPGLDGRKMSKSYNNTIPLFCSHEQLRRLIGGITTDSRAPGQAKSTEGSALFALFQAFAAPAAVQEMRAAYAAGMSWGDIKAQVFACVDAELAPMRARYEHFVAHPDEVEDILQGGAARARTRTRPLLKALRHAVGLRRLHAAAPGHTPDPARDNTPEKPATEPPTPPKSTKPPRLRQYRELDASGAARFFFKLLDADGTALLQGGGFAGPREAADALARVRSSRDAAALEALGPPVQLLADSARVLTALGRLADA